MSLSFTHTPVGVPRGIVFLVNINGLDNIINSATYGGVSLTKLCRFASGSAATEIYFLGAGVPTGPKTVSVTASNWLDYWVTSVSLTGALDLQSAATNGYANSFGSNPSVTLPTISAFTGMVLSNIRNSKTPGSGFTAIPTAAGASCEYGAKSGANVVANWISGDDFNYQSAIAVQEAPRNKTRVGGGFVSKPSHVKISGVMTPKPTKIKTGGTFV